MNQNKIVKPIKNCRVCKRTAFTKVLTLGPTPLANAFLTKEQINLPENYFPLDVYFCEACGLVQLGHVVDPKVLFSGYVYVSSTSPVFIKHFEDFVKDIVRRFKLDENALIIDIGSNDGILLKPFKKLGSKVLGIEPASKIANLARKAGIDTIAQFFSRALARNVVKKYGRAKIITATNVFAHIDDLDEVIKGLEVLLEDDGIFIMEAPYLIDFLEKRYFDLVYHEHLSYWAVAPLMALFKRFDMTVFDVQKVAAHGGSIRVFVKRKEAPFNLEKRVGKFLTLEKKYKLGKIETYFSFANEVLANKIRLVTLLIKLKKAGKRIAAYGAPAKGNTLLNFFSIGTEILDYVVDDSPWKQGLYTPGKRIPVVSSKKLYQNKPDYLLILAWNFADSIMQNHTKFKALGGRFIIPVPSPKIV